MWIIVEGPDATGKSTLAKKLAKKLNMLGLRFSVPPHDDLFRWYCSFIQKGPAVWDRSFYSELVYQPLFFNQPPRLTWGSIRKLEARVQPALVVWCTAPAQVLIDRLSNEHDSTVPEIDQQVMANAQKYIDAYEEVRLRSSLPGCVYDSSKMIAADAADWIYDALTRSDVARQAGDQAGEPADSGRDASPPEPPGERGAE